MKGLLLHISIWMLLFETASFAEKKTPEQWVKQGQDQIEQKKYIDAIQFLKQAIALRPQYALAYSELGLAAFLQNNFKLAFQSMQNAMRWSQDKNFIAVCLYHLGRIQELQGDQQAALLSYQRSYLDRKNAIVQKRIEALSLSIKPLQNPAFSPEFYLFIPVFLEGPYSEEEQFWKKREKTCKEHLNEENSDDRIPQFSHEEEYQMEPIEGGFLKLLLEINKTDTISIVKDFCITKEKESKKIETYHVFYQTKHGLYVLSKFAEAWQHMQDANHVEIKSFDAKDVVPGGGKEVIVRFSSSRFFLNTKRNRMDKIEDQMLFLIGTGPTGRPSAILPLLIGKKIDLGKEVDDKKGLPKEYHLFMFTTRFWSGGNLEIKKKTKQIGELNPTLLGKHPIRFL